MFARTPSHNHKSQLGRRLTSHPSPCLKYLQQMALQGMSKQKFTPKGICKKRPGVTPFSLKPIIARRQGTLLQNNSTKKKLFPPPEIVKQHTSVIIITIFPTMMANMLLKQKFFEKGKTLLLFYIFDVQVYFVGIDQACLLSIVFKAARGHLAI